MRRSESASAVADHRLLYDSDCGFCRWTLGWVLRWDRSGRLAPLALQSAEAERLLAGMSQEERMSSWHLVDPAGRVASAGEAIAPLMRLLPAAGALAALAERLPGTMIRLYRWTAARRSALGRLVGEGARRRADAVIARRRGPS